MPNPFQQRIDEVNAEINELEGAIWELKHVPNTEASRKVLQAELDWYHEELHQLMFAAKNAEKPPADDRQGAEA